MKCILVIEDEVKVAQALKQGLEEEGYAAEVATTGEEGFFLVTTEAFDVVILDLTSKEFNLLAYLVRHNGRFVTRDMIALGVWKETIRATPLDNVIDVHIARLRKKIDQNGEKLIHTIRGAGFIIRREKS